MLQPSENMLNMPDEDLLHLRNMALTQLKYSIKNDAPSEDRLDIAEVAHLANHVMYRRAKAKYAAQKLVRNLSVQYTNMAHRNEILDAAAISPLCNRIRG